MHNQYNPYNNPHYSGFNSSNPYGHLNPVPQIQDYATGYSNYQAFEPMVDILGLTRLRHIRAYSFMVTVTDKEGKVKFQNDYTCPIYSYPVSAESKEETNNEDKVKENIKPVISGYMSILSANLAYMASQVVTELKQLFEYTKDINNCVLTVTTPLTEYGNPVQPDTDTDFKTLTVEKHDILVQYNNIQTIYAYIMNAVDVRV